MFVVALLNSKLVNWFYTIQFTNQSNLTVNLSKTYLSQIPIAVPDNKINKNIELLAKEIIVLLQDKNDTEAKVKRDEIDQLVYQLYDLTPEEIELIENSIA